MACYTNDREKEVSMTRGLTKGISEEREPELDLNGVHQRQRKQSEKWALTQTARPLLVSGQ